MPSFKEYKPVIEIPKLVSLDIIDLNRRLRKRKNRVGTNLWDILPDDVIPHIVKHKIKLDFDKKWDFDFIVSKYNSNYNHNTLNEIALNILDKNNWDYRTYLNERTKRQAICDDYYDEYTDKLILDYLIKKLQEDIENNLNFEYLNYFKEYTKKEVILKRFDVGKTYYRTFKNKETNETIKIPFTIIEREDIVSIGKDCKGTIIAVIDGTDIKVRLRLNYVDDKKKKDDDNLYLNEYVELHLCLNKKLREYLEDNNLKVIRYKINA